MLRRSLVLQERFSRLLPSPRGKLSSSLTHVDAEGKAKMVDVSRKEETERTAVAVATVDVGKEAFKLLGKNVLRKGDALSVAQLAGVMGAKRTSELIPLCHPLALTRVDVSVTTAAVEEGEADDEKETPPLVFVRCTAKTRGRTGVEMEALTGASVAALTVYDMCKAVTKSIVVKEVKLVSKTGGKSGDYRASDYSNDK